jgi:hypothetical protein
MVQTWWRGEKNAPEAGSDALIYQFEWSDQPHDLPEAGISSSRLRRRLAEPRGPARRLHRMPLGL